MFSSEFFQKCFKRPQSASSFIDGFITNRLPNFQSSFLTDFKNYFSSLLHVISFTSFLTDCKNYFSSLLHVTSFTSFLTDCKNYFSSLLHVISFTQISGFLYHLPATIIELISLGASLVGGTVAGIAFIVILILFPILWYLFFNDRNLTLAIYERFGRGVKRFSGKVVWVVGASTSLGEEIALKLATVGAKIILSGRRTDILHKLKTNCIEKSKGKLSKSDIFELPFDITDMDENHVKKAIEHFGKIDVLIYNTGHIELGEASKEDITKDKALFDVNFFGPIFIANHVVEHFKQIGGGQIIVMSSISGKFSIPGQAAASASKHALNGYFDSLRTECKGYKIYITVVCPGLIRSSVTDNATLAGKSKISVDEQIKITKKGLKTERCVKLALVAGANYCFECWISNQPFLLMASIAQYFPSIHKYIMSYIFSKKRLEKIYKGESPNIWMWRPLFAI